MTPSVCGTPLPRTSGTRECMSAVNSASKAKTAKNSGT